MFAIPVAWLVILIRLTGYTGSLIIELLYGLTGGCNQFPNLFHGKLCLNVNYLFCLHLYLNVNFFCSGLLNVRLRLKHTGCVATRRRRYVFRRRRPFFCYCVMEFKSIFLKMCGIEVILILVDAQWYNLANYRNNKLTLLRNSGATQHLMCMPCGISKKIDVFQSPSPVLLL